MSGGGYGTGQLTHALGLLFRLLPERAAEVTAYTGQPAGASVDLHDAIALRLEGGAIGTVSGTALPPGTFGNEHQLQIRMTGDRGQLLLDLDRPIVRRSKGAEDDVRVETSDDDRVWSFQRVIDRFVDLAAGRPVENRSPGELGARVVEVLDDGPQRRYGSAGRDRQVAPNAIRYDPRGSGGVDPPAPAECRHRHESLPAPRSSCRRSR